MTALERLPLAASIAAEHAIARGAELLELTDAALLTLRGRGVALVANELRATGWTLRPVTLIDPNDERMLRGWFYAWRFV